jgi:glycosyltransferase involved in cell wall biosynthesis
MLEQRRRLCQELAVRGIDAQMLITACDENLDLAREYGAIAVETPNKPLGRKCNTGLQAAAEEGADWIVWIGSDDWVHRDVFDPLPYQPEQAPAILIGRRAAIVDLQAGRMRRCVAPSRYGVIPWIVPRRMLEPAGFAPVDHHLSRGLDGGLIRGMRRAGAELRWHVHDPHDLRIVDFKTAVNITPYDRLAAHAVADDEDPWPALEARYPADLVALARRTHIELQEA